MKSISYIVIPVLFVISLLIISQRRVVFRDQAVAETISPILLTETPTPTTHSVIPQRISDTNNLKTVIDTVLKEATGSYGIVIKNFATNESYYVNRHKVFDPASLYKLWVMATVYSRIQNGKLTEDQVLSRDIETLNKEFNIDPELAEKKEGTETHSVRDALTQMITVSDNYSALLLSEKVGLSSVASFLRNNGLYESSVGTDGSLPSSTPYDISLFLEKLYGGELANQQYTQEMIDLLKQQQRTNGIPKYLPDTLSVANKTGEIDSFKHDAGIVFTGKGDYIIVAMSDTDASDIAQENIALISKGVYDYFTGK